ncbi:MAG: TlpA disulfide reductase family protein [Pseudomonadota bacterium]
MRFIVICRYIFALTMVASHVANAAEPLAYEDINGQMHTLKEYKGKWVVLNYWASWCEPCRMEIPDLIKFQTNYATEGALAVVGINVERKPREQIRASAEKYGINYTVLIGKMEGPNDALVEIKGLPTTAILAPDGEVLHIIRGKVSYEYLTDVLERLKTHFAKGQLETSSAQ